MTDKLAPNNTEAEQAVLGSILYNPDALDVVRGIPLYPDDFFLKRHEHIYEAMLTLLERGDSIDTRTIADEVHAKHKKEKLREETYLNELMNTAPTSLHAETYGRLVFREATRRKLKEAGEIIKLLATNYDLDTNEAVAQAHQTVFQLSRLDSQTLVPFESALSNVYLDIQAARTNPDTAPQVYMNTYWRDLNRHFFIERENSIIIAARPGEGKSAALTQIATWNAKAGKHGLFASMEMSERELVQRIIAQELGISTQEQKKMSQWQWDAFAKWCKEQSSALNGLMFETSSTLKPSMVAARARDLRRRGLLDFIIIDYIQLMHGDGKAERRDLELGSITRAFKELARELKTPVISAAQLSREGVRAGQRPALHHLRESGNLEQDSDSVLFIYNKNRVDDEQEQADGERKIIIAKQRNGPSSATVGDIPVIFIGEKIKFENARV